MSRRLTWLAVAVAVCAMLAVIVYSRQAPAGPVKQQFSAPAPPPVQQDNANAQAVATPTDTPVKPKETCTLNVSQAPDLGGITLGMPLEEVLAFFPGSKDDPEVQAELKRPVSSMGESTLSIKPATFRATARFPGITQITVTFLDGRVSNFTLGYNGPKWDHVDEFVAKFADGRNLPNAWEPYAGMDTQMKMLKCDGFEVTIFAGGRNGSANNIRLNDTRAQTKLQERRAKAIEKAEKEAREKEAKEAKP